MSECTNCSGKGYRIVGSLADGTDDHEVECYRCAGLGRICDDCGMPLPQGDLCFDCAVYDRASEAPDGGDDLDDAA